MIDINISFPALDRIAEATEDIRDATVDPRFLASPRIKFTKIQLDPYTFIEGDIMAITLTDSQQVEATIQPVSKKGNPTSIDGIPTVVSADETIATATMLDATTLQVKAAGAPGSTQVTVSGDADLTPGVKPIFGLLDVTVVPGEAFTISINPGVPTEQA